MEITTFFDIELIKYNIKFLIDNKICKVEDLRF